MSADRCDRLRRRSVAVEAGAARRSRPLSFPASRSLAWARGLDHRDGRRRRARSCVPRGSAARCRHGVLLRAFDGSRSRFRGTRPARRDQLRPGRLRRGRPSDHLSGRSRQSGRNAFQAPAQSPGNGRIAAETPPAGHRVPGLDRHRLREPVVRDAAGAGGTLAGDDLSSLGASHGATDRRRGPAGLPARSARSAGRSLASLRDRRSRSGFLRADHARIRAAAGAEAVDDSRALVDALSVEPVAGAGDSVVRPRRPETGRKSPQSDARLERSGRCGHFPSGRVRSARRWPVPW